METIPLYSELIPGEKRLVGYATLNDNSEIMLTVDDPETCSMINSGDIADVSMTNKDAQLVIKE